MSICMTSSRRIPSEDGTTKEFARLKQVSLEKMCPFVDEHDARAPHPRVLLLWKVRFWP